MNTENKLQKKSRKRNVWYFILALPLVFLPLYIYFTFFHVPSRVYTRENTGLERLPPGTAIPMMPDGSRVDYVRAYELIFPHLCEKPEKNGWWELVSFLGPAFFVQENPNHQPLWENYCRAMALDPQWFEDVMVLQFTGPGLVENAIIERLEKEAESQAPKAANDEDGEDEEDGVNHEEDELLSEMIERKLYVTGWDAEEYPEMAEWVAAHDEFLNRAAHAVRRERYVLPFRRDGENMSLLVTIMPDISFQRVLINGFRIRATMYLQQSETEKALADAESIWRLGRHLRRMPRLIPGLTGMACEQSAGELTLEILRRNTVSPERMAAFSEILEALPAPASEKEMEDVEHWAGYEFFDSVPMDVLSEYMDNNLVLGKNNSRINLTAAAERYTQLRKMDEEKALEIAREYSWKIFISWSVRARSERIAEILYHLLSPGIESVRKHADRAECAFQLTRLTLSLKRYRAQHGVYPDSLDALAPEYFAQIPLMTGLTRSEPRTLTYARRDDGFLLAAVKPGFDPEKEPTREEYEYDSERPFVVKMPN